MAEKKKYNSILISGRKDQTLTYSKYVKDEESGESVKESLDKKVNVTDELTTQQIKDGAITNEKMAADSVGNTNLQDGSVSNEKLEDGSITNEKLAENSITKDKLKDNTIGAEKLDPELRKTINAATGLPENLIETIQNVDKTLKDHQSQLDDKQSQIDDKQQQITANDDDISLLQTRSTQMEEAIKDISASGGASQASAVTYENTESGLDSVTAQGAIDELSSKKFNKENIAQEFGDSKDKVVSQFALPFREIESPEFIKAIVDAEDHFLFGIQLDGSIEWGKGIPAPIRAKLREIINQCQQDKTDILEAINAAKKELSASISALQEGKVDKEEGKSLIEDEVKECFTVIENEEFIMAVVDSENRLLFGIYRATGKPYFPLNEMYHVEQNEEFFAVWLDADDKILLGIRRDGEVIGEIHAVNALKQVISQIQSNVAALQEKVGTIYTNLKELIDVFFLKDNEEFLAVEQDAEGKVLSATNPDGSHYIYNVKSETILTQIEEKTDIENRQEMTLDEEGHILSYRDKNGVKHETALDVEHFSMKGESIDFSNYATQDDVNGIELKNIDGVYDNSKPNLYLTSQKTYTTADGKQSFTPPNAGAEMSNKIHCKPGEWFTRTGTATGMVVVSDKNDNNAKRLMPNGSLPKASVQVPEYWDWAAYIRFAVATYENNVTINRGKYAVSESSESVSIPKLKLNVANFTKETKYLKSPNGTFFELSVSDKGVLSVKEIDKDLVAPFDVPSDLKFTISNPSGGAAVFCGNANRVLLHNEKYLYEVKETGLTKFLSIADSSAYFYNVEHQVNSSGKSRIVALLKVAPFKGLCVFDENFILIDQLASPSYDTHDFIYIDDFHYIVYHHSNVLTIDGHRTYSDTLEEWKNGKMIGSYTLNDQDVLKDILFDADVHSTAPIAETHTNTIGFDRTEDRIIVNPRNCCSWIILKRTVSSEDKVTFGPVLEQVGGLPSSSNYGAVARRIKTDSLAQWFLCHDVKYWGLKEISGVSYPTYTLFDNNYLMKENPRNNPTSNPTGATDNAATCSRIVQLSIDWTKRKIVEYKVYVVPSYYSSVMSSAWMMDEGMFCIDYAMMGTIIFADFTTEATTVTEDNHLYTNAKITWKLKQQKLLYRANIY